MLLFTLKYSKIDRLNLIFIFFLFFHNISCLNLCGNLFVVKGFMNTLSLEHPDEIGEEFTLREHLKEIIQNRRIIPHFQPIVDLYTGEIHGYEMLSRAEKPFENPAVMFEKAKQWKLSWELEFACRNAALKAISSLPSEYMDKKFFLNVSPDIFSDPRFVSGTTLDSIKTLDLNPEKLVIEITESTSVDDYEQFEKIIQYCVGHGFNVALDDFGAGHSGLLTLLAMAPHYIKIDCNIIFGIQNSPYKQKVVKSITDMSINLDSSIIAEGIETYDELCTVFRLGVRYVQGFFLGRPAPSPQEIPMDVLNKIDNFLDIRKQSKYTFDISISGMVIRPLSYPSHSLTCGQLDNLFRSKRTINHIVLLNEGIPVTIITRSYFYSVFGGRFGFAIYEKKYVDDIAKTEILFIHEYSDLRTVSHMAMSRCPDDLYDPVIVVDENDKFLGTVTMKQIINKATDLEIKIATCTNPLSQLPGNMIIGFWLEDIIKKHRFSIIYCDLDNFKEYNDIYGFSKGDDVLKITSRILSDFFQYLQGSRLGHIGGDDFIIISDEIIEEHKLVELCNIFDHRKSEFFSSEQIDAGYYFAANRKGQKEKIPLLSMSIAVVTEKNFNGIPHPGQLGQVAALVKKEVKKRNSESGCSGYLFERRMYND